MKQLLKISELVGKTITKAEQDADDCMVAMRFDDDSFVLLLSSSYDAAEISVVGEVTEDYEFELLSKIGVGK